MRHCCTIRQQRLQRAKANTQQVQPSWWVNWMLIQQNAENGEENAWRLPKIYNSSTHKTKQRQEIHTFRLALQAHFIIHRKIFTV